MLKISLLVLLSYVALAYCVNLTQDERDDSVGLGTICTSNITCQEAVNEFAYCDRSTYVPRCRCNQTSVQYEDSCFERKDVGSPCKTASECAISIYGEVECDVGINVCLCSYGYLPNAEFTMCVSGAQGLGMHFSFLITLLFATGIFNLL